MLKTITLTANEVTAVELVGGCHAKIENRGTSTIYVSKSDDVAAGADGTMAVSASATKYMKDAAAYMNVDGAYDYHGTIYLVASEDGIAEIETGNYFFNEKNMSKGGGGGDIPSDVYTKDEVDTKLGGKVDKINGKQLSTNDYTDAEKLKLSGLSNYDDTALQTAVASKISSTDYATDKKGGAVKVAAVYGIDGNVENSHTLGIIRATDAEIEAGTNIRKPIVPANLSKAMSAYGINSKTQIADIKNSQIGENLIKCPYVWESGKTTSGCTMQYGSDGILHLSGTTDTSNAPFLCRLITKDFNYIELNNEFYILKIETNVHSNTLRLFYTLTNDITDTSGSDIIINDGVTELVIDNRNGEYKYLSYISLRQNWGLTNINYDNVYVKVSLEKGNISHEYQPYQLSRQSLRDDIDAIMALM